MYTKQVFVGDSGALWSLTAHPSLGQLAHSWVVEYPIGEWAVPRQEGSLLFVDQYDIEPFHPKYNMDKHVETWECEVRGITKHGTMLHPVYISSKNRLTAFWSRPSEYRNKYIADHMTLSQTGCLVEGVKLVRRI